MHTVRLVIAAGLVAAALPAAADCRDGITELEKALETNTPAGQTAVKPPAGQDRSVSADRTNAPASTAARSDGDRTATGAPERLTEKSKTVREAGGTTTYAPGGPARPRENWFGKPPIDPAVLKHLSDAKQEAKRGDEQACLNALEKAKASPRAPRSK